MITFNMTYVSHVITSNLYCTEFIFQTIQNYDTVCLKVKSQARDNAERSSDCGDQNLETVSSLQGFYLALLGYLFA